MPVPSIPTQETQSRDSEEKVDKDISTELIIAIIFIVLIFSELPGRQRKTASLSY